MIEKTTTQASSLATCGLLDAETAAALALNEDAKQSCQLARDMKKEQQQERINLMHQAADKLREMASAAIGSAIWQGVAGMASAACSLVATLKASTPTGAPLEAVNRAAKSGQMWNVASKLAETTVRVDPFSIQEKFLAVDKQELDTRAEVAGNRAQDQADFESDARRLEESATQLLQKSYEARHAASMAALRG